MMKLNEPLTPEEHAQANDEYRRVAENQKKFIAEIASIIESGEPLNGWQRKWAASVLRGAADGISTKRPLPVGKKQKVPEEAILLRQVYINSGMRPSAAEERLAKLYHVDLETLQSRIKRLSKKIDPNEWGFDKWGAN